MRSLRVGVLGLVLVSVALAGAVAGCGSQTGVVVAIYSDLPADELSRVVLRAETGGDVYDNQDAPWKVGNGDPDRLPGSVVLLWGQGREPMDITVTGTGGARASSVQVVRRARIEPVEGQLQLLRIALTRACTAEDAPACEGQQSCVDGFCADGPVGPSCLATYREGDEESLPCQGNSRLRDTRTGEAVPVSGAGCSSGESCIEGCCVQVVQPDAGPDGPAPDADGGPDLPDVATPDLPDGPATPDAPRPDLPPDLPDQDDGPPDIPVLPEEVTVGENREDTFAGPVDDTWLEEDESSDRHNTDTELEILPTFGRQRVALLRFHLDDLAGARVISATLRLQVTRVRNGVNIHQLKQVWDDDASWNEARNNEDWSFPGCSVRSDCREEPPLTNVDLEQGRNDIELPAEAVQAWIQEPDTNQGLLLQLDIFQSGGESAKIVSSEGANGQRPRLVLTIQR